MYCLSILLCVAAITFLDVIFAVPLFAISASTVVFHVIISVVAVIAVDGLTAFIVRWLLPEKWFNNRNEFFAAGKNERLFLEKIGIKKWKDRIPELGSFTAFRKNKIRDPKNNEYVSRYIAEANYGVAVHIAGIVFGFAIVFILPLKRCLLFGVPVAIVNAVYNGLSLAILRYNLPKLHQLYRINEKRAARAAASAEIVDARPVEVAEVAIAAEQSE